MTDILGSPDKIASFANSLEEHSFPMAHAADIASFAIAATPAREAEGTVTTVAVLVSELINTAEDNDNATVWDERSVAAAGLPQGSQVIDVTADPNHPPILEVNIPESGAPPQHIPSFNTRIVTAPVIKGGEDQMETTIMVHVHPHDFEQPLSLGQSRAWATVHVDPNDTVTRLVTTSADFTQPRPENITADTIVGLEAFLAAV